MFRDHRESLSPASFGLQQGHDLIEVRDLPALLYLGDTFAGKNVVE